MTALVVVAIVLGCIAAYLLAGWRIAMKHLPQSRAQAIQAWSSEQNRRESVRARTACILFFWPFIMTVRAACGRLDEAIDSRDPVALAAKVAEKDRYIAQLEREAGIRR